jgi:hypothetical protein
MKITIDPDALTAVHAAISAAGYSVNISRNVESSEINVELPAGLDETTARGMITDAVKAWRLRGIDDFDPSKLKGLTLTQLNAYIDANVTDLASARAFLKKLAALVLYFLKRELNEV